MENQIIKSIEEKIADLKRRWPAHSVTTAMFQELEDLEEELEKAIEQYRREQSAKENSGH